MDATAYPAPVTVYLTPYAFLVYAKDFLRAGVSLEPQSVPFSPVQNYLFARAVELALKAFLLTSRDNHGVIMTVEELRLKYSHRLNRLLAKAEGRGLLTRVPLTPEHCNEILTAHKYYGQKVFEYPRIIEALNGYPHKPSPDVLRAAAELLVANLETICLNAKL